jgi:hypothetical protein
MSFEYSMENLQATQKLGTEKYFQWIRGIVTMATGLVGILVSLKSGKSANLMEHNLFVGTIALLAAGILLGVILMYSEIYMLRKLQKLHAEQAFKQHHGDGDTFPYKAIEIPFFFTLVQWLCVVSLVLALISLVWYASCSDSL